MMMRMLMLMMMPFALTQKERHGSDDSGSDDSGSDDSGSDRTESDFVGSSDSEGRAKKRKRKPMTRRGNKGQEAARKQTKSQRAAAKKRNRANRAPADAAPAAASARANDGYLLRRLRHRSRSPCARGGNCTACCAGQRRHRLWFSSSR